MTDFNSHINDLIVRHLCGDTTPEEQTELQQWTSSSADNERYYLQQRELWFSATDADELSKYNKEAAYAHFRRRVAEAESENQKPDANPRPLHFLRYVAAAVVLCLVGFFAYRSGQQTLTAEFTDIVIEAPQGSHTQMTLPDGSRVWLNAGSKIAYSQGFGLKDRIVRLVLGEGYFEVARNERLPFSVSSENLKVEVLGTKFNFRDYPDDAEAIVSLQEGSVALSARPAVELSPERTLNSKLSTLNSKLIPGQAAIYNKHTGKMTILQAPVAEASQWTQGILVFNGEPLPDIVRKLERSYNVKITLADKSLSELRFHGDFARMEQSLREVLDVLAATGRLRYEIAGNQVTIYSK